MKHCNKKVVAMDSHKENIVIAILPYQSDHITERLTIQNNPKEVERMVQHVTRNEEAVFVYEAGPCGYDLQRQIAKMGHECVMIAPSLTPKKPGDRVKTDRRDAEKLARYYRAGELTEIHIPTAQEESDRDLVRAREDAIEDRLRRRNRLSKFLLRQGRIYREGKCWSTKHQAWLKTQKFEWDSLQKTFEANVRAVDESDALLKTISQQVDDLASSERYQVPVQYLRTLKGVDTLSALTLIVETQDFKRFQKAKNYMSFAGLSVSENSSGQSMRRGSITKAGNRHIRRVLGESAWSYRHGNVSNVELKKRREPSPAEVVKIAKEAQVRLHRKFSRMTHKGKPSQVTATGVARELSGFVWAIAQHFPPKVA